MDLVSVEVVLHLRCHIIILAQARFSRSFQYWKLNDFYGLVTCVCNPFIFRANYSVDLEQPCFGFGLPRVLLTRILFAMISDLFSCRQRSDDIGCLFF